MEAHCNELMKVFRPPGLAPGFVALRDESTPTAPYYFCAQTGDAQWRIPRAATQEEQGAEKQEASAAAAADREKLVQWLKGKALEPEGDTGISAAAGSDTGVSGVGTTGQKEAEEEEEEEDRGQWADRRQRIEKVNK